MNPKKSKISDLTQIIHNELDKGKEDIMEIDKNTEEIQRLH